MASERGGLPDRSALTLFASASPVLQGGVERKPRSERFRETTRRIANHQSKVKREEGRYTSKRIRRLYRRRARRRDHAMDALARDLFERLYEEGVSTVYVGDLTDVLETHWSVRVNQKTHNFWAFRAFIDRLASHLPRTD